MRLDSKATSQYGIPIDPVAPCLLSDLKEASALINNIMTRLSGGEYGTTVSKELGVKPTVAKGEEAQDDEEEENGSSS
ncbi:unnamed protein product [Arabis nemorensis]|uniref:Uncharacterized protein n=1 Tax=Arabis nemorensis TaxID=586526 RepID=A0A565CPM8_9BRAS|nr:unnamed protein product [Arabis nemorensis]